jgi:hypothetical protein
MNNVIVLPNHTQLKVEGDAQEVSDCAHTFKSLYQHRNYLFSALIKCYPDRAWRSFRHHDGSVRDNMFIAGLTLPTGKQITYHMNEDEWILLHGIKELKRAPKWDNHESGDVIERLEEFIFQNIKL